MSWGKNLTWKKRLRGSNIVCSIILRLLGRISSGEKGRKISGKKIKINKNGVGEEYQVKEFYAPLHLKRKTIRRPRTLQGVLAL